MASQKPANFDLIIFDCDGVLVDSESIAIDVFLEILVQAGLTLNFEEASERFLGRSLSSIRDVLRIEHQLILTDEALEGMRQRLYARFQKELEPIEGIAKTLAQLDIPYCVASSSQIERIRLTLEVTGLISLFEGKLFSASMVAEGKPAPDLFRLAAKSMDAKPQRCLVIEDSPAGVAAAKRAGMTVFGFTGGSHARNAVHLGALKSAAPDTIFSQMLSLPKLITDHVPAPLPANPRYVMAVDVGTASARAGVFDQTGQMLSRTEHMIAMNRHGADHAEYDSEDIWRSVCVVVKAAIKEANVDPAHISGISFDATCSLVVRGENGAQCSVSMNGHDRWDTIAWLDHRAKAEADACTATEHRVLTYLGDVMSPEMQTPKLMWLKKHMPQTWDRMGHVFDLADFLTWRASGSLLRSRCTMTCKWTYLAHEEKQWQQDFFDQVGLNDFYKRHLRNIEVRPVGDAAGPLTAKAAGELGLTINCKVGIGLIDAFGGTLGVIGAYANSPGGVDRHLALIAGTSSCVTTLSKQVRPAHGIWGPYFGAALDEYWLNEGGQSATGALLDHVIREHSASGTPDANTHKTITKRIMDMRETHGLNLAGRLHVLPDFHGNRSPYADPHALGVVSGLSLDTGFDSLCKLYWRTAVAIALGVRHILDALNENGYGIDTLHVTGGHTKNKIMMELYCDATGCTVIEPLTEDATLLGTAMVAATAAGFYPTLSKACTAMHQGGAKREPNPQAKARFDKDYAIFLEMHRQRQQLDALLVGPEGLEPPTKRL